MFCLLSVISAALKMHEFDENTTSLFI